MAEPLSTGMAALALLGVCAGIGALSCALALALERIASQFQSLHSLQ